MNTVNGKNLREGSKICREQLVTIEDLEMLKAFLINEISDIKNLLRSGSNVALNPHTSTLPSEYLSNGAWINQFFKYLNIDPLVISYFLHNRNHVGISRYGFDFMD